MNESDNTGTHPKGMGHPAKKGDRGISEKKMRRFWFHFSMFCIACFGMWLITPQFEKEFLNSRNFYNPFIAIFSNLRASIGFVILLGVTFASALYDYRYRK